MISFSLRSKISEALKNGDKLYGGAAKVTPLFTDIEFLGKEASSRYLAAVLVEPLGDRKVLEQVNLERKKKFDEKYNLGFSLLSDPDHKIAEAFGVWGEKKMYGKSYMGIIRSHFVIDPQGIIEDVQIKVSPKNSLSRALNAIGDIVTKIIRRSEVVEHCNVRQAAAVTGHS